jgi:hypothetical protein
VSEMIERVARALCAKWKTDPDKLVYADPDGTVVTWPCPGSRQVPLWTLGASEAARAAIEAMREPTEGMIQTACTKHTPGQEMKPNYGECPKQKNAAFRWCAMIDAALA